MTDELDVIAGLTPEQAAERAKSLQLEVEYWRQILTDCEAVNGAVRGGTTAILDSTTAALALTVGSSADATLSLVETIIAANRQALDALKVVSDSLGGMLSIADGRTKALGPVADALLRAAGVEPGGADSGAS